MKREEMNKQVLITLGIAAIILFSGCAGMISGDTQKLIVKSTPAGANVLLNGVTRGQTPLEVTVEKRKELLLIVSKEGYKDVAQPLNTVFDNTALVGLLSYGTPISTDVRNGTAYQISPNYYQFELQKEE